MKRKQKSSKSNINLLNQGQKPSYKCLNIKDDNSFSIFLYCLSFLWSLVTLKLQTMKFFMQTLEQAIFDEFKGNNSALSQ